MPFAAPHGCTHPGCRALVPRGTRRCKKHEQALRRYQDRDRGTPQERGYDETWRKLRAYVLRREPLCRFCSERGRTTPATVVDHIVPISQAPELRLEPSNLRALCESCHNARTAREQSFGRSAKS